MDRIKSLMDDLENMLQKLNPEDKAKYNIFEQKRLKIMSDDNISSLDKISELKKLGEEYGGNYSL
jgi:hypothetical protein